jgi:hypothetical protein
MENKNFIINESERERILQKHQDATKNLYLNVISEQTTRVEDEITLEAKYNLYNIEQGYKPLVLSKGTSFKFSNSNQLSSNTNTKYQIGNDSSEGVVMFSCNTKRFFVKDKKGLLKHPKGYIHYYKHDNLADALIPLCGEKNTTEKQDTKTQKTQPNYISIKNQELKPDTSSMSSIILLQGTKFFWNNGGYSFKDSTDNPKGDEVNTGKWRWFSCKTKKFNFGDKGIYVNSQLSNELFTSNDLCRNFLNPKGTKPKTTGSSGTSKQGLVKPTDEVITKLINMVK